MSKPSQITLEERKLRELIKEYSKSGYSVYADFKGYPKPEKIGNFTPDLILKLGDQTIIMEIATSKSLRNLRKKVEYLARYAEEHENVRFDIVLTNPKPRLSREERQISKDVLLRDIQNRLLAEAEELYKTGYYNASLLLLNTLLENALKEFAIRKKALGLHEKIPMIRLASKLRRQGIISKGNFKSIERLFDYRNRIVHKSYQLDRQTLVEMLDFVSHFARRAR